MDSQEDKMKPPLNIQIFVWKPFTLSLSHFYFCFFFRMKMDFSWKIQWTIVVQTLTAHNNLQTFKMQMLWYEEQWWWNCRNVIYLNCLRNDGMRNGSFHFIFSVDLSTIFERDAVFIDVYFVENFLLVILISVWS